jgi:uncharacterized membrane protein
MTYDTYIAFAATYSSVADAEVDYEAIKSLYYDLHAVDTFDAAIVAKHSDGKVKIEKKHEQPTRHGAWLGAGIGLGAGLLVALFPAVGLAGGILVGTAGGAGIGALAGHVTKGMTRHDLKELGEELDAGSAGLVAVAAADMADRVGAAMKRAERVTRKELKADREQLEKDLEEAKQQSAAQAATPAG